MNFGAVCICIYFFCIQVEIPNFDILNFTNLLLVSLFHLTTTSTFCCLFFVQISFVFVKEDEIGRIFVIFLFSNDFRNFKGLGGNGKISTLKVSNIKFSKQQLLPVYICTIINYIFVFNTICDLCTTIMVR